MKVSRVAVVTAAGSSGEGEAGLLPLDVFVRILKSAVERANQTELGEPYARSVAY